MAPGAGPEAARRRVRRRLTAVTAGLTAVLLAMVLSGCGGGGVRVEDADAASGRAESKASPLPASPLPESSAPADEAPQSDPSASAPGTPQDGLPAESGGRLPTAAAPVTPPGSGRKVDVVALLRKDPAVGSEVKSRLRPCSAESWPIDVAYSRLTGQKASDVVVNVSACVDGEGMGSYVYRYTERGGYAGVYAAQSPGVYAEIKEETLRVHMPIRLDGDLACCPSGEDVVTFAWRNEGFRELERSYQEFPGASPGAADRNDGSDGARSK